MDEVLYTATHCWVRQEQELVVVGITDYAQEQLSEVTFVELPEVGENFSAEDEIAVVESVKSANEIYAPLAGRVVEVNDKLHDHPELINQDPFGEGWMFKMRPDNPEDLSRLLDSSDYEAGLPNA